MRLSTIKAGTIETESGLQNWFDSMNMPYVALWPGQKGANSNIAPTYTFPAVGDQFLPEDHVNVTNAWSELVAALAMYSPGNYTIGVRAKPTGSYSQVYYFNKAHQNASINGFGGAQGAHSNLPPGYLGAGIAGIGMINRETADLKSQLAMIKMKDELLAQMEPASIPQSFKEIIVFLFGQEPEQIKEISGLVQSCTTAGVHGITALMAGIKSKTASTAIAGTQAETKGINTQPQKTQQVRSQPYVKTEELAPELTEQEDKAVEFTNRLSNIMQIPPGDMMEALLALLNSNVAYKDMIKTALQTNISGTPSEPTPAPEEAATESDDKDDEDVKG